MKPLPPTNPFSEIPIAPPTASGTTPQIGKRPSLAYPPGFSRQTIHQKKTSPAATFFTLLGIATVTYLACGYFLVPFLIKSVATRTLAQHLDRPVTIGIVDFNPFTLRLTLANGIIGPKLSDPDDTVDPIISFSTLSFDLDIRSLTQRAIICQELSLSQPFLHLVHKQKQDYNISLLLPPNQQSRPSWLLALIPSRYSINNVNITRGEILFDDQPTTKMHHLQEINFGLPTIANIDYQNGLLTPHFSATVNGTPIEMTGQAQMAEEKTTASLNLTMNALDLAAYKDYLPPSLGIRTLSGQADLDLNLLYAAASDVKTRLRLVGTVTLRSAKLQNALGQFTLDSGLINGGFDPASNRFHADEIDLHHPVWQRVADEGNLFDALGLPAAPNTSSQDNSWADKIGALLLPNPEQETILPIKHLQITNAEINHLPATDSKPSPDWQAIDISINTAQATIGKKSQQAFFTMNAKKETGSQVMLQGSASSLPFEAKGLLMVNHTDIATVQNLWQRFGPGLPIKSGVLEQLQANFTITLGPDQHPSLTLAPLSLQAKNLQIEQQGQLVSIPIWQSEQGSFSLSDPTLHLGKVQMQQASITYQRQSSTATWQGILSAATPPTPPMTAIDLSSIELSNSSLLIENQGPPDIGLRLERLDLQVENFDRQKENTVNAAAMLEDKYSIQANGTFSMAPFTASLNIQTSDLQLSILQPIMDRYFTSPINGVLSTEGILKLPSLDYQGQWAIDSLSAPPLSCRRLSAESASLSLRPFTLTIDRLNAQEPALQVTAQENGMPQLPAIMQPGWQPAPSSQEASVAIKFIDIEDGAIIYDLPNPLDQKSGSRHRGLTLSGQKITGSLENFIVAKDQPIPFTFTGALETHANFQVQGIIRPFASTPGIEMKSQIDGLPLIALAPLLEPYWGFNITAGNLDFANQLTYENTLIQDSSHLTLHGLSLGKRLAPESIKALGDTWQALPAVQALLQDTNETINFTVPIDGRTDTGFTYQTALKAFLTQLLLKATVSPLNLLSNNQPPPDDTINFAPGESQMGVTTKKQVNALAALLKERPLLVLNLTGFADSKADSRALLVPKKTTQAQTLATQATISEKTLLSLANKRSQAVQKLLADQGLSPQQIRVSSPKLINTDKAGASGCRVSIYLTPPQ